MIDDHGESAFGLVPFFCVRVRTPTPCLRRALPTQTREEENTFSQCTERRDAPQGLLVRQGGAALLLDTRPFVRCGRGVFFLSFNHIPMQDRPNTITIPAEHAEIIMEALYHYRTDVLEKERLDAIDEAFRAVNRASDNPSA